MPAAILSRKLLTARPVAECGVRQVRLAALHEADCDHPPMNTAVQGAVDGVRTEVLSKKPVVDSISLSSVSKMELEGDHERKQLEKMVSLSTCVGR